MVYRYYHRLSPWQQRVYRQSDQITVLTEQPANHGGELHGLYKQLLPTAGAAEAAPAAR
jgi:hypothetical protein